MSAWITILVLGAAPRGLAAPGDLLLAIENPEAPTKAGDDNFAAGVVEIDDDYLAAGAPSDDPINPATGKGVSNAGSVYVIRRTDGTLFKAIRNPRFAEADAFGTSIAVATDPGTGKKLLVVGSPGYDSTTVANMGAVYVIDPMLQSAAESAQVVVTLLPTTPRVGANFGSIVRALGANILVGVQLDDPGGVENAGSVFLYRIGEAEAACCPTIENPLTLRMPEDRFGASIHVLEGGDLAVGTPSHDPPNQPTKANAGRVYVFTPGARFDGDGLGALLPRLTIENPALDDVAPSGSKEDVFGSSLGGHGTMIVAGAPGTDIGATLNAGRVYAFDSTTGQRICAIGSPEPDQLGASFGATVEAGATFIAATAPGRGVPGAPGAGSVYLFAPDCGSPVVVPNPEPSRFANFGSRLAAAGAELIIGTPGAALQAGVLYLYTTDGEQRLNVPNPEEPTLLSTADGFGGAVAAVRRSTDDLRGTGLDLVVGASNDDAFGVPDAGSAYLLDGQSGDLLLVMHNPHPLAGAFFGGAVGAVDRGPGDPSGG
jgi:hypothetical protein